MSRGTTRRRHSAAEARVWLSASLLAFGATSACTDAPTRSAAMPPASIEGARSHIDSVAVGYFKAHETRVGLVPHAPSLDAISDGQASIASVSPGWFQGSAQSQTITVTLNGPVNSVTIRGSGAILCTGTYGTIVGYDKNGVVLGSAALSLIDQSDCGWDDVTFGAQGTLTVAQGVIARFDILPMNPVDFPVAGQPGGKASAYYSVSLGVNSSTDYPPVPAFTAACNATTFDCTFDASGSRDDLGIASYAWDLNKYPGGSATGVVVRTTYPHVGWRAVTLTVTDTKGQKSALTKQIYIGGGVGAGQPPTVNLSYSCTLLTCTFTDNSVGGTPTLSRAWDFGDGATAGNVASTTHTFAKSGYYYVQVKVTDGNGLYTIGWVYLQVTTPLPLDAYMFLPSCLYLGCAFDSNVAGGTPPYTRAWTFGDGTSAGDVASPSHLYAAGGTYVVTVTVKDAVGAQTSYSRSVTLTADNPPVAQFTYTCAGQQYAHQCAFDASLSKDDVGIVSYKWDWGNGRSETRLGKTSRNTWASAGTYTVTLTVTDTKGQTNAVTQAVVVP